MLELRYRWRREDYKRIRVKLTNNSTCNAHNGPTQANKPQVDRRPAYEHEASLAKKSKHEKTKEKGEGGF